ncbi:HotDog domain-containing protein, partial [Dactylonectria macrodidyma]
KVKFLISLGPTVGGYPGVCHGGIVATILDEVTSMLFPINKAHLCRAWANNVEGRKYFLQGTIEDGDGTVVTRPEALYIVRKEML